MRYNTCSFEGIVLLWCVSGSVCNRWCGHKPQEPHLNLNGTLIKEYRIIMCCLWSDMYWFTRLGSLYCLGYKAMTKMCSPCLRVSLVCLACFFVDLLGGTVCIAIQRIYIPWNRKGREGKGRIYLVDNLGCCTPSSTCMDGSALDLHAMETQPNLMIVECASQWSESSFACVSCPQASTWV